MKKKTHKKELCDCIDSVTETLIETILKQKKEKLSGYKILKGEFEQRSFYPSNQLYSPFTILSTYTKAGGSESKPRKDTVNVSFSFCPFCGTELIE